MKPRAFGSAAAFRAWLARRHAAARELVVRCFKVQAAERGLTYRQALDEALCFGWIDGVRHALDAYSFSVRFTPRRRRSSWSDVNRRRAAELEAEGRMHAAGRAALAAGTASPRDRYSFEAAETSLSPEFDRRLRARPQARAFLDSQPPWYRRTTAFWVMSAKQPQTRERRFRQLLECSGAGRAVPPLAAARAAGPRRGIKERGRRRARRRPPCSRPSPSSGCSRSARRS